MRELHVPKRIPRPSFLDDCKFLGAFSGRRRWRNMDERRLFEWDDLHGEIEVYNRRGKHLGVLDAVTGDVIKPAVRARQIDV